MMEGKAAGQGAGEGGRGGGEGAEWLGGRGAGCSHGRVARGRGPTGSPGRGHTSLSSGIAGRSLDEFRNEAQIFDCKAKRSPKRSPPRFGLVLSPFGKGDDEQSQISKINQQVRLN